MSELPDWFARSIVDEGKLPLALVLLAFIVTFLFIRLSVRMIRAGVSWWPGNVSAGGVHVHHAVFGVVFMLMAGVGGFSPIGDQAPWEGIFAALFGVGAALVLDEFALILHLKDVYWSTEGRTSVDVVFLATALMGLVLLGVAPFGLEDAGSGDAPASAWYILWIVALGAAAVVVSLLKGKIWTGLLGVFLPIVALVGAVRLARPNSPWAHRRYRPGSAKALRSASRERTLSRRWRVRALDRAEDAVAGKPGGPSA